MQKMFFTLVSKLPMALLYVLSDVLYIVLYWMIGYRKGIVTRNLANSFPEMSSQDVMTTTKDYYRHLCDLIVETIKTVSISEKQIKSRVTLHNDLIKATTQDTLIVTSHLGNWEWMGARQAVDGLDQSHYIIYKRIKNDEVEELLKAARQRLGNHVVEMADVPKHMAAESTLPRLTAFIADQTPSAKNAYWLHFLNQDTAVFRGIAVYAKRYNLPIIYAVCKKVKRGKYAVHFQVLTNEPSKLTIEEILDLYMHKLEADIRDQIPYWLWSHRRWKHMRPGKIN